MLRFASVYDLWFFGESHYSRREGRGIYHGSIDLLFGIGLLISKNEKLKIYAV